MNDFAYMRAREEEMRDTNGTPTHCICIHVRWPGCSEGGVVNSVGTEAYQI